MMWGVAMAVYYFYGCWREMKAKMRNVGARLKNNGMGVGSDGMLV